MAQHGKGTAVLVGKFDMSPFLNNVDWSRTCETADTTTFGAEAKTYIPGLKDGSMAAQGLYDASAGAVDEVLSAALGAADTVVSFLLQGAALQNGRVKLAKVIQTAHDIASPVSDVVSTSADFQPSAGVWGGVNLKPLAAVTAAANGATYDAGAASANGAVANLHLTAFTGTNITVKVQHSVDGSTWVDLLTFTQLTDEGAEQVTVSGTVNRYRRVIWTGTFTSATFAVPFATK